MILDYVQYNITWLTLERVYFYTNHLKNVFLKQFHYIMNFDDQSNIFLISYY